VSETRWTFDYAPTDPRLASLYTKAKHYQWDAATSIDWTRPIDPSRPLLGAEAFPIFGLPLFKRLSKSQQETLNATFTAMTVSQFLHGEQGALMVASKLVAVSPQYEAKLYAASQVFDEARHVEAFERYVKRCGELSAPTSLLVKLLELTLGADHWTKMMVGMQVIVEGVALAAFHNFQKTATDPTLKELLGLVIRDESRHVAFGQAYLRLAIDEDPDVARGVEDFTIEALLLWRSLQAQNLRLVAPVLESLSIDIQDVFREVAEADRDGYGIAQRRQSQADGLTDFVLPALRRVGLLTEQLSRRLEEARFAATGTTDERFFEDLLAATRALD
jgi:hypothetical protein